MKNNKKYPCMHRVPMGQRCAHCDKLSELFNLKPKPGFRAAWTYKKGFEEDELYIVMVKDDSSDNS